MQHYTELEMSPQAVAVNKENEKGRTALEWSFPFRLRSRISRHDFALHFLKKLAVEPG